ncbi:hypothetical protein ABZE59_025610, partial [Enterobacter cloacae subsp. cloacae]
IRCPASSSAIATIFTAGVSVFMVGDSKYRQALAPLIFLCLYLLLSGLPRFRAIDLVVIKPITILK